MKVQGGAAVDPDSGLEDKAHVYINNSVKYSCVLGMTDIQTSKNSFYKIQLIESNNKCQYWVFRSWGRIGTTVGGHKLDNCSHLNNAKDLFEQLYEEKSGNSWKNRDNFVKVPGRMYPIDIDYGDDDEKLQISDDTPSKLSLPVQNLMKIIFDVTSMKNVLKEFELDTEKMPLGETL